MLTKHRRSACISGVPSLGQPHKMHSQSSGSNDARTARLCASVIAAGKSLASSHLYIWYSWRATATLSIAVFVLRNAYKNNIRIFILLWGKKLVTKWNRLLVLWLTGHFRPRCTLVSADDKQRQDTHRRRTRRVLGAFRWKVTCPRFLPRCLSWHDLPPSCWTVFSAINKEKWEIG